MGPEGSITVRLPPLEGLALPLPPPEREVKLAPGPGTVAEVLAALEARWPGVKARLTDPEASIGVAVNGELLLSGDLERAVAVGDLVEFVMALSGG